ncbi:CPBP family intramembrane metalloprotease [Cyanobacterium stanieri LEGE 03274]|uniref:CPBP family intramembrane metalloprotease n=1 Tax=Cyanobacterium stanieri LEGE 03274 TaxID=1828756 RepID=A0ABR9V6H5_9CHRO|nr:type II CAAX endopeptidase family protein [Cyanobacterium stanieri]MBE9223510.1 CPBP family intramembrane metalloprotease [Cyanobacterium stanieri LEGE 03274]
MNIKRSLLAIITVISLLSVFFALGQSLAEPQVQSQLELYQTNLILNVAELETSDNENLNQIAPSLVGNNPYQVAEKQYEKVLNAITKQEEEKEKELITLSETPRQQIKQSLDKNQEIIEQLTIKIGLINATQNNTEKASEYWQQISNNSVASTLNNLWQSEGNIEANSETIINENLEDWFKLTALTKYYQNQNNQDKLLEIKSQQQTLAEKATIRLIILSIIPFLGGVIGTGLLIFLLIQWLLKKESSIIAVNGNLSWELKWDWETILQVLIIGFFFVSQILLPILFSASGFNPAGLSIRGKALYVLVSYFLMAGSGLLVLYLSVKPFFPLPEGWFKLTNKNWFWWGLGGYLTAIPLVFLVSFLNQQIWHGQGGSNPLLMLALESQDKVALLIFFITASVAAPIFEEIVFRGFLLPSLTRYMPVWGAIILSGGVFAIAHLSLSEILPLATLGILLGIVYTRSRSLLSSIMVHSLWNSGTLFSLFLLGSKIN